MDLSHDLGGVWYLEVLWLARPNLPRQSAIANQNPLDHVPVPDIKCWFRPCASLMPTIYRAMGLDAASNRYPPDIQHGRHTKDSCLRSDKFSSQPPLASNFWGVSSCHSKSKTGTAIAAFGRVWQIVASTQVAKIVFVAKDVGSGGEICPA